jgi:UDP-N-acetylglucosamine--N-acetylmuramyl-(pentapeptide) pyrophosphoryl-undecaprenol N-acetylglucosamine transferase
MGGFTSAPPALAGRRFGAATFLHESNTIPGRANRWLSRIVNQTFVGFPEAANRLHARESSVTGTPVRGKFHELDQGVCRTALGLDPNRQVVLVMGGSQGAHGINQLVSRSLQLLAKRGAGWQWLHLAGAADAQEVEQGYRDAGLAAKVYPFFAKMELVMGAASAAVSRAGASSLAELAATRLPSLLVPFPAATDNHQFWNARAFEQTGAAKMIEQSAARPEQFVEALIELMQNEELRRSMQDSLHAWHKPHAAEQIADSMLKFLSTPKSAAMIARRTTTAGDSREDSTRHHAQALRCSAKQQFARTERATIV